MRRYSRDTSSRAGWVLCLVAGQLCLALGLAGCGRLTGPIAPIAWLYPSATPTETLLPTSTATQTESPTLTPSATATASPLPTATVTATTQPLSVTVSLDQLEVTQGRTLVVRASTNRPSTVEGEFEERPIRFLSRDGRDHVAYLGVSATAKVMLQPLRLTARSKDGQQVTLASALRVSDGGYGSETLRFTTEIAKLLDPEITRPELLRLAPVYATFTSDVLWRGAFDWPIEGPVTSRYGTRRQYGDRLRSYHTGMDIDGETGDAIRSPARGVVRLAEELKVRGGAIVVDHGAGVVSGCYHLSRIDVVAGQEVARGEVLGAMGSTGLVTGSHLHWELRVGGVAVSPLEWTERAF